MILMGEVSLALCGVIFEMENRVEQYLEHSSFSWLALQSGLMTNVD